MRRWAGTWPPIRGGPCGGAALLGVHLEGPCLSSEYKGAMPEHLLMHTADAELFAKYQKASGGHVRYTTLAPEIPGVPGLIPRLNAMGIVCAMGHSGAGYDQCAACVDAGVRSVTHLGNAMRLFHQHEPAIMGAVLAIQGAAWGLAVGLILFFMLFEGKKKASEQVAVGAADDKANQ